MIDVPATAMQFPDIVRNWGGAILIGLLVVALLAGWKTLLVSPRLARKLLAEGALVVDVRTSDEYASDHLPNVINVPFQLLVDQLPRHVIDKNQAVLLHCQTGPRAAVARQVLKTMGYTRVYNLGSLARARRIVNAVRR